MVRLQSVASKFIAYGNMGNNYNVLHWKEQDDFGVLFASASINIQFTKERVSHTAVEREDVFQDQLHSYSFKSLHRSVPPSYDKGIILEDECFHGLTKSCIAIATNTKYILQNPRRSIEAI